jgi:hypothetical protein
VSLVTTTIGFSDHSGWAVLSVLSGTREDANLLFRERVQLCPPDLPRQPYHAVAEQGAAMAVIEQVRQAALELARRAIADANARAGGEVASAAVAMGRTAVPNDVTKILASHTLLHSAEGELYRELLAEAAAAAGLRVVRFLNKEVRSEAAAAIGLPLQTLEAKLGEIGKMVGSPWTKDEKDATAAAWLALATISSR